MPDASTSRTAVQVRPFLRRYAWLMVAVVAVAGVGGYGASRLQKTSYTATAHVLVEPLLRPGDAARTPDMGTEKAVVSSGVVVRAAAATLHLASGTVTHALGVTVPVNADLLDISYSARTRAGAQSGANAVATAYAAYRNQTSAQAPATATTARVPGLHASLLSPAALPGSPSAPDALVDVLVGIVAGLLLAVLAALAVDRLDGRIYSARRWEEITGIPVVLELGRGTDEEAAEDRAGTDYVRALVERSLSSSGGLVLVTSVYPLPDCSAFAHDLWMAFMSSGQRAGLIDVADLVAAAPETVGGGASRRAVDVVAAARDTAPVVIVNAPLVASSAVTLDIARQADAVLLVDRAFDTRRHEVTGAVAQLEASGATLVGAVITEVRRPRDRRLTAAALTATDEAVKPVAVVPIEWAHRAERMNHRASATRRGNGSRTGSPPMARRTRGGES